MIDEWLERMKIFMLNLGCMHVCYMLNPYGDYAKFWYEINGNKYNFIVYNLSVSLPSEKYIFDIIKEVE